MYMYTSLYTLSPYSYFLKWWIMDLLNFFFVCFLWFVLFFLFKKYLIVLRSKIYREGIFLRVKQKISGKTQTQIQVRS